MWIPRLIVLTLLALYLVLSIAKDGKKYESEWSAPNAVINVIMWLALLGWGGFFRD